MVALKIIRNPKTRMRIHSLFWDVFWSASPTRLRPVRLSTVMDFGSLEGNLNFRANHPSILSNVSGTHIFTMPIERRGIVNQREISMPYSFGVVYMLRSRRLSAIHKTTMTKTKTAPAMWNTILCSSFALPKMAHVTAAANRTSLQIFERVKNTVVILYQATTMTRL